MSPTCVRSLLCLARSLRVRHRRCCCCESSSSSSSSSSPKLKVLAFEDSYDILQLLQTDRVDVDAIAFTQRWNTM